MEGIQFYNRVFQSLRQHNMKACVTLYHWDMPSSLFSAECAGWTSEKIIPKFVEYASVCFEHFGSQVDSWITFNEPKVFVFYGYGDGSSPPGMKDSKFKAARNVLLAHAHVVRKFRTLEISKKSSIGITLNMRMFIPQDPLNEFEKQKCQEELEKNIGLWADPLFLGDYPAVLLNQQSTTDKITLFTAEEKELLKGTVDFLGINYYSSTGIKQNNGSAQGFDYITIGLPSGASWLTSYPDGLVPLLEWLTNRYKPVCPQLKLKITENGYATNTLVDNWSKDVEIDDTGRVNYYKAHVNQVLEARKKVPLVGYYAWSITDNFEWHGGYTERFGLIYIDFEKPDLPRTPKQSLKWFTEFLKSKQ
eukprot:TRINITY_DN21091_c0_g1_i2.p1 TRINITY_DN21091_c0_g1~~TRINITY_DN21091_c0_g1_i2.p1  ORF type:complete len:362 (-),score=88.43 TRINITY_DN21091_c0_g1_i2:70-1155(-)